MSTQATRAGVTTPHPHPLRRFAGRAVAPLVVSALSLLLSSSGRATPLLSAYEEVPLETAGSEPWGLLARSPVAPKGAPLPLEGTTVEMDVRGLVAATTVTQRYVNPSDKPLEAVYVFPLPHEAAVYDMEIRIGNRVIRSVIKEKEEARQTFERARAEGKRAALVEQERPNIFTASVTNIMPNDRIDVQLRFVEPLRWNDGTVRITFPTVVGPRYIPGNVATGLKGDGWSYDTDAVPDASRITPPVHHPKSTPRHDLRFSAQVDLGLPLESVSSPSHPIRVTTHGDGSSEVHLAEDAVLPKRDLVLELKAAASRRPETALFLSPDSQSGARHFMLVAFPPSQPPQGVRLPIEMLFVVDVSGSMAGTSITQARAALHEGLRRLRPEDTFNIVAFNDGFVAARPASVPATLANRHFGRGFVDGLSANGGTEMLPALEHAMAMPPSAGALRMIVLITDGCLGNEEQVFAAVKARLGQARLFTVAIGSAPNHFLATKIAEYGRGTFTQITDVKEVAQQMGTLLDRIESPVLSDVRLRVTGLEATEVYPARIPDLFAREPLVVHGRLAGSGEGQIVIEALSHNEPYSAVIKVDTQLSKHHPGIVTLWARQHIKDMLEVWRDSRDEQARARQRAEIVKAAITYNLVTAFTSLVAVEEVVVNPAGRPSKSVVPTELPEGWQLDSVFGAQPATGTADSFLEALALALLLVGLALLLVRRGRAWSGVSV
jgi:Ca-activated chloride channel homolog